MRRFWFENYIVATAGVKTLAAWKALISALNFCSHLGQ